MYELQTVLLPVFWARKQRCRQVGHLPKPAQAERREGDSLVPGTATPGPRRAATAQSATTPNSPTPKSGTENIFVALHISQDNFTILTHLRIPAICRNSPKLTFSSWFYGLGNWGTAFLTKLSKATKIVNARAQDRRQIFGSFQSDHFLSLPITAARTTLAQ